MGNAVMCTAVYATKHTTNEHEYNNQIRKVVRSINAHPLHDAVAGNLIF